MNGFDELRKRYPWPTEKPEVPPKLRDNGEIFGWFNGENRAVLQRLLTPNTDVVLELGALLGLSTGYLAGWAPNATVITIDHWKGSREHQKYEPLQDVLDCLFETFCSHLWNWRTRIVPMRTRTLIGMVEVYNLQITPRVVYIDASHETGPVFADTMLAMSLWPEAWIVGDDGGWKSIQQAHREIKQNTDRELVMLEGHKCAWQIPPAGRKAVDP